MPVCGLGTTSCFGAPRHTPGPDAPHGPGSPNARDASITRPKQDSSPSPGKGGYAKVPNPTSDKASPRKDSEQYPRWCFCTAALLAVAFLLYFVFICLDMGGYLDGMDIPIPDLLRLRKDDVKGPWGKKPESYSCNVEASDASTWSSGRKEWCCKHVIGGCPTTTTKVVLGTEPYDCSAQFADWRHSWSHSKKDYCCKMYARGCPSTTSALFDCDAGFGRWKDAWSEGKKLWCCTNEHRGCAQQEHSAERSTTNAPPDELFDCAAGYDDWQNSWKSDKRAWCCKKFARGCSVVVN